MKGEVDGFKGRVMCEGEDGGLNFCTGMKISLKEY